MFLNRASHFLKGIFIMGAASTHILFSLIFLFVLLLAVRASYLIDGNARVLNLLKIFCRILNLCIDLVVLRKQTFHLFIRVLVVVKLISNYRGLLPYSCFATESTCVLHQ